MTPEEANEPIVLIIDKDGYVLHAGQPGIIGKTALGKHAIAGNKIETTTFQDYKSRKLPWIWDKKIEPHGK